MAAVPGARLAAVVPPGLELLLGARGAAAESVLGACAPGAVGGTVEWAVEWAVKGAVGGVVRGVVRGAGASAQALSSASTAAGTRARPRGRLNSRTMWVIYLEAFAAAALLVFFVWWTMRGKK